MKPRFMSDPLMEVVFCVAKRGEYCLDSGFTKARLLNGCETFEHLKDMNVLLALASEDTLTEESLSDFAMLRDYYMPQLDRLLRWPWDENYEG